jgi:hypothetical protein
MKALFLRFVLALILLMALQTVNAQSVITEYFDMKSDIKINLNDKNVTKTLYSKGVLDIDWDSEKHVLAISYDPKQTKIQDIMFNVNNATEQGIIAMNNKTRDLATNKK